MNRQNRLLLILTVGVFGILNTEMGIMGVLPLLAEQYQVSIAQAGLLVSLFALVIAVSAPITPLLLSGINRKKIMVLVLSIFTISNVITIFSPNFTIALIARVIPAFFHPVYCSLAFTVAAASVPKSEAPAAVSKVFIGVSAGMVIGVPLSSFLAGAISLEAALSSFAFVNTLALLATLFFIPSMPVKEKASYGTQLRVLKRPSVWLSIFAVIFMNGAIFGVFSFFAEYLSVVTGFSWGTISMILFIYGAANIPGSLLAGKLLTQKSALTVAAFPVLLGAFYILLFAGGSSPLIMAFLVFLWGILGGIGGNINQYWITSAASDAPDFANGLFLTASNLGVTIGASFCGYLIAEMGTQYMLLGGLLFSGVSIFFIAIRMYLERKPNQASDFHPFPRQADTSLQTPGE